MTGCIKRLMPSTRPRPSDPQDVLHSIFGFETFRGEQEAIIRHVIAGGDALVLMPTGGGKSLCYQVPARCRPGLAVGVSPLAGLMQDHEIGAESFRGGVGQYG